MPMAASRTAIRRLARKQPNLRPSARQTTNLTTKRSLKKVKSAMSPRRKSHRVQAGPETREMALANLAEAEARVEATAARLRVVEGSRETFEAASGAEGTAEAIPIDPAATDINWARRPTSFSFLASREVSRVCHRGQCKTTCSVELQRRGAAAPQLHHHDRTRDRRKRRALTCCLWKTTR